MQLYFWHIYSLGGIDGQHTIIKTEDQPHEMDFSHKIMDAARLSLGLRAPRRYTTLSVVKTEKTQADHILSFTEKSQYYYNGK